MRSTSRRRQAACAAAAGGVWGSGVRGVAFFVKRGYCGFEGGLSFTPARLGGPAERGAQRGSPRATLGAARGGPPNVRRRAGQRGGGGSQSGTRCGDRVEMILPQVHLRKPCYDFTFL